MNLIKIFRNFLRRHQLLSLPCQQRKPIKPTITITFTTSFNTLFCKNLASPHHHLNSVTLATISCSLRGGREGEAAGAAPPRWTPQEATSPTTPSSGCSSSATGPPANNSNNSRTVAVSRTSSRPVGRRIWDRSRYHWIWIRCRRCFRFRRVAMGMVVTSRYFKGFWKIWGNKKTKLESRKIG